MPEKASLLQQTSAPDPAALEREIAGLILEVALVVSKQYGIQLRADSEENGEIFRSLRHFARYVAAQRMK